MPFMDKSTDRLIKHFGTRRAAILKISEALEVHEETVRLWFVDGIPLSRAIDIERGSGGVVTAEQILREAKAAA